jgi:hypothetical protein
MDLDHNRDECKDLVKMVMNLLFPLIAGNVLSG